jgi:hypothetical protein
MIIYGCYSIHTLFPFNEDLCKIYKYIELHVLHSTASLGRKCNYTRPLLPLFHSMEGLCMDLA